MSKSKIAKLLPQNAFEIRNGGIYLQKKRCGKSNCKCTYGEKHVAYYFFTRVNGKLTKTYVRKSELEKYDKIVEEAWERKFRHRELLKMTGDIIKKMNRQLRENNAVLKANKAQRSKK
jgi:hypothetical protein